MFSYTTLTDVTKDRRNPVGISKADSKHLRSKDAHVREVAVPEDAPKHYRCRSQTSIAK